MATFLGHSAYHGPKNKQTVSYVVLVVSCLVRRYNYDRVNSSSDVVVTTVSFDLQAVPAFNMLSLFVITLTLHRSRLRVYYIRASQRFLRGCSNANRTCFMLAELQQG